MIDPTGGYLMLNAQGEPAWLIIKNKGDFRAYCELAEGEDNLSIDTLTLIKEKKQMPFYHGRYLNLPAGNEWDKHSIASEAFTIHGSNYVYTTLTDFKHSTIDEGKIYSFNQYLDENGIEV